MTAAMIAFRQISSSSFHKIKINGMKMTRVSCSGIVKKISFPDRRQDFEFRQYFCQKNFPPENLMKKFYEVNSGMRSSGERKTPKICLPNGWIKGDPRIMPCRQAFEPFSYGGHPLCFFRLFCINRTCTPKPDRVPLCIVLGQRTSSDHEHSRGRNTDRCQFRKRRKNRHPVPAE